MNEKEQFPRDWVHALIVLSAFRATSEESSGGSSLLDQYVPIGLTLAQIVHMLELTPNEREFVLGKRLIDELNRSGFPGGDNSTAHHEEGSDDV